MAELLLWLLAILTFQIGIGLSFVYVARVTFERVGGSGWYSLRFVGYTLIAWSFTALVTHIVNPTNIRYVHTVGLLAVSIAFLLMTVNVVRDYRGQAFPRFTVRNVLVYVAVSILLARVATALWAGSVAASMTSLYLAAPVIVAPAVYAMYQIHQVSETRISLALLGSAALMFVGHLMNLYAGEVCGDVVLSGEVDRCARYLYDFIAVYGLPTSDYLVAASVSAPAAFFLAFLLWGYGQYTLYHHTVLRHQILETVTSIAESAGPEAVREIVAQADQQLPRLSLSFRGDTLEIYSSDPVTQHTVKQIEDVLMEEFGQYVVPENRTRAEEAVQQIYQELRGHHVEEVVRFDPHVSDALLCPLKGDNRGQPDLSPRELIILGFITFAALALGAVWLQ